MQYEEQREKGMLKIAGIWKPVGWYQKHIWNLKMRREESKKIKVKSLQFGWKHKFKTQDNSQTLRLIYTNWIKHNCQYIQVI